MFQKYYALNIIRGVINNVFQTRNALKINKKKIKKTIITNNTIKVL